MITIELLPSEVATKLKVPETAAQEILRRLFFTSTQILLNKDAKGVEKKFKLNLAEKPSEYTGQINNSPVAITVQYRGWEEGCKIKDKATLLTYIEEAAPQVWDLKPWK
uniref:Uncharacterized protein n=1 Tax=Pseudomonas phage RVTF4 TaxID=3236931 RepID=A0AB39CCU8_9VIRU